MKLTSSPPVFTMYALVGLYFLFDSSMSLKSQSTAHAELATTSQSKSQAQIKTSIFESFQSFKVMSRISEKEDNPTKTQINEKDIGFKIDTNPKSPKLGNEPILYHGWIKFFKYLVNQKSQVRAFFVNPEFTEQQKRITAEEIDEIKDNEWLNIKDKNSFYATVYQNEILISKSKANSISNNFDVLKSDFIEPISDQGFAGGISEFGSFKEGECFKVKTNQQGNWVWIICSENGSQKASLMGALKKIVLSRQQKHYLNEAAKLEKENKFLHHYQNTEQTTLMSNKTVTTDPRDGYWMVLQGWSTCTKACGNGTRTMHRMCIPPKQGGRDCEGESVITEECNVDPCPSNDQLSIPTNNDTIVNNPTMQVLPFSNRPQRYDKCHIKESDVLLTTSGPNAENPVEDGSYQIGSRIQIPVRLIMNNETLTAYSGFQDEDKKVSFYLQKSKIIKSNRDENCLVITDKGIKDSDKFYAGMKNSERMAHYAEFCPFTLTGAENMFQEWYYDFNLFKYQCHEVREITFINTTQIEDLVAGKAGQLRLDLLTKRKEKEILKVDDTAVYDKIKTNTLSAIKKENNLEKLLEQELLEAQKEALEEKAEELKKEKCKVDALSKAIKLKEIENQYTIMKSNSQESITRLEDAARERIDIKRAKLKEKLQKLKAMSKNQLSDMDQQIQTVRIEYINSLTPEESYDTSKCKIANSTNFETEKKIYCAAKHTTSRLEKLKCETKTKAEFLVYCCDLETNLDIPQEYKNCVKKYSPPINNDGVQWRAIWDSTKYLNTINSVGLIGKAEEHLDTFT